jgi:hypothetical protein
MTSRTGLYMSFVGMALTAACTLAFVLPGLPGDGDLLGGLGAVGAGVLMAGRSLGVLLIVVGLLVTALAARGTSPVAKGNHLRRPGLRL